MQTVSQLIFANKSIEHHLKVTTSETGVQIQGTTASLRLLAKIIESTANGSGNVVAVGCETQLTKGQPSGFMLSEDSVEKTTIRCDADFSWGKPPPAS
jgi:hypothetical protein